MTKKKNDASITQEIINKVHITLSNLTTGAEILNFLKETEPIFMEEVSRFVANEVSRLKYEFKESTTLYIGSVIAAAYISGLLISREAQHTLMNGTLDFDSTIQKALNMDNIDSIIDGYKDKGKSYEEIGKCLEKHINKSNIEKKSTKKKMSKKTRGKRLNINGLEE